MNNVELFEHIGDIDSDLITRCEKETVYAPQQTWIKRLSLAACLCLTVLCIFTLPRLVQSQNKTITSGNYYSQPTVSQNALLNINKLKREPSFQCSAISLNKKDFIAMTDDEFLKYYGVFFRIKKAVPALELQPQNPAKSNGIFKNNSRGIYYDSHAFVFANNGNTQQIEITLGKTAYYKSLVVGTSESNAQIKQSEINGFGVTIFQYAGKDGSTCYHTEFMNNGIAYCITSNNLSQKGFVTAMTSVITNNIDTKAHTSRANDTHTVTGTVNAFDANANLISISVGNGVFSTLKIYLPGGEAKSYSVGNKVKVSYIGNPVTICTIWRQQLKSISIVED